MPSQWPQVPVSRVATPVIGGTPSREVPEYWNGDIPWATAKDIAGVCGRYLVQVQEFISEEGLNRSSAKLMPRGTVVITARGTVGAIAQLGREMTFNQTCYALLPTENLDNDFLFYVLKGTIAETQALTYGTVFNTITTRTFAHWLIPLPPLPEQRAIAHILGTLDDKIELLRRMNDTLEAMARALFKSWFVDFDPVIDNALAAGNPIPDALAEKAKRRLALGDKRKPLPEHLRRLFPDRFVDSELGPIPAGWAVKHLRYITANPQYGYTASASDVPVGPKFLRITDINKRPWIDWSTVPFCRISGKDYEKYRLGRGDILIARMADPGHGVVIEENVDAVFASYLIRFRPLDVIYDRYIQYWLRSHSYWELVNTRKSGTTRSSMNARVISNFLLLVPSRPIVAAFREMVSPLRSRIVSNIREKNYLAATRDALLPKLIRGEMRLRDAERFLKESAL